MKRRITLSIALALCVVYGLQMSSDSTVIAQRPQRHFFDTGIVPLDNDGETEVVRITVATGAGDDSVTIAFKQMTYTENGCTGGGCRLTVSSQSTSEPIILMPGEAASIVVDPQDPTGGIYVRGLVLSNSPNVKVNTMIINTVTGAVISMLSAPNQSSKLD